MQYHNIAMTTHIHLSQWPLEPVYALAADLDLHLWLVGGAVRDALLNRPVHDWDFAVDRDAIQLARAVADALGGAYYTLDAERGTGRVILTVDEDTQLYLDFALLRSDGDLKADLLDRDFTINAIALDETGELIDPTGGRADLKKHLIRAVSEHSFRHDPVRLLRAVRQEAQLHFQIEPQTEGWIRRDASLLLQPSSERLRDEFVRGMALSGASAFLRRLEELDLLFRLLPELEPLAETPQSMPHRFDVWRHTLAVVDTVERVTAAIKGESPPPSVLASELADVPTAAWGDLARRLSQFSGDLRQHLGVIISADRDRALLLKLAALLHDVGKPETRSVDEDDHIHFYGHEPAGARLASRRLQKLRFSRDEARFVHAMVDGHLRPAHLARAEKISRRAVYRYFRDLGEAGVETVLLSLADHLATWGPNLQEQRWTRRLEMAEILLTHYFERREETIAPPPLLDGHELMAELGLKPGPEIGRLLKALQEAQASGEIQTREEALAMAAQISKDR